MRLYSCVPRSYQYLRKTEETMLILLLYDLSTLISTLYIYLYIYIYIYILYIYIEYCSIVSDLQSPSRTCPATKSVLPYIILPSIYDVMLLICSRGSRFAP